MNLRRIVGIVLGLFDHFLRHLPNSNPVFALKRKFYSFRGSKIGRFVKLMEQVRLSEFQSIEIGENSEIGDRCTIDPFPSTIKIGKEVLIAANCYIRAGNHVYDNPNIPIRLQGHTGKPIRIEDNVWIGANCTILSGVTIGQGAIVAAGAVVTKNVESMTIVGGVPAKLLKSRRLVRVSEAK
jgi:acetyltransferase-like isoleucine patch superfamily enzyme